MSEYLDEEFVDISGKILWSIVTGLFVFSGVAALGTPFLKYYTTNILLTGSLLGIVSYIITVDGLKPNPQSWFIGILIDIVILIYIIQFQQNYLIIMYILGVLAILGFVKVFVTEILPELRKDLK